MYNQHTSSSSRNYIWDYADQLKSFFIQSTFTVSEPSIYAQYLYSGGQRVKKLVRKASGILETTVYIDGMFEHRFNSSSDEQNLIQVGSVATVRIGDNFAGDVFDSMLDKDEYYQLSDHLGSVGFRLSNTGALIDKEEYYPFGDSSLRTWSSKRYRYVGREKDIESQLYYYGARYYSAWTCRFISTDPLAWEYSQLTSYNYAGNKPINHFDIDGMQSSDGGDDNSATPENGSSKTENGIEYTYFDNHWCTTIEVSAARTPSTESDSENNISRESVFLFFALSNETLEILEKLKTQKPPPETVTTPSTLKINYEPPLPLWATRTIRFGGTFALVLLPQDKGGTSEFEFHQKQAERQKSGDPFGENETLPKLKPETDPDPIKPSNDPDEEETVTLYRGSSYYEAMETVQSQTFDIVKILERQLANPSIDPQAVYFTKYLSEAKYWGSNHYNASGSSGWGVVGITLKKRDWERFKSDYPGVVERYVPQPQREGMTEIIIPFYSVNLLKYYGTPKSINLASTQY